jgi:hypothetical protein
MRRGNPPRPGAADIELCNGTYLNLADPDPLMITVDVIAHHLSQTNRYAGAPRRPFSVLEHTLLVSEYLNHNGNPPGVCFAGLHHDDTEAFIHDVTRPFKEMLPDYRSIEANFEKVIAKALQFDTLEIDTHHPAVREADHWALSAEAYFLMPSRGKDWWCAGLFKMDDDKNPQAVYSLDYTRPPVPSALASMWLTTHHHLTALVIDRLVGDRRTG